MADEKKSPQPGRLHTVHAKQWIFIIILSVLFSLYDLSQFVRDVFSILSRCVFFCVNWYAYVFFLLFNHFLELAGKLKLVSSVCIYFCKGCKQGHTQFVFYASLLCRCTLLFIIWMNFTCGTAKKYIPASQSRFEIRRVSLFWHCSYFVQREKEKCGQKPFFRYSRHALLFYTGKFIIEAVCTSARALLICFWINDMSAKYMSASVC